MSDEDSIAESKAQLEMVETALLSDPSNNDLLQLKTDLTTLLQLLDPDFSNTKTTVDNDTESSSAVNSNGGNTDNFSQELSKLEGMKVMAPICDNSIEMGQAVIISAEPNSNEQFDDILVRVVFSHPTLEKLVPCKYYLDGKCRRSDDCRWSHGELRKLGQMSQYEEESQGDVKIGAQVLSKGAGGLWLRGTVKEIVGDEYLIQNDVGGGDPFVKSLEELYLLDSATNDAQEEASAADNSISESFVPHEIGTSGIKFGEWENYTKGIGSKLMLKMGWVVGNGLGSRGGGRVEPVTARLYPMGKSIDWCMDMRDKYGDNIGQDVEVIMKREAKEALKRSKQVAAAAEKRDNSAKSLFDFINVKLGGKSSSSSSDGSRADSADSTKSNIKQESDESLKLRQFKMSENVGKLEKEISRLRESYNRHKLKDPSTAASIQTRINEKAMELTRLQSASKSLSKEAGNRKSKSKLTIF